jgi:colanic acid biosynthesis glycosyl transferase WcaI
MHILVVTQYFWPEAFRINDLVAEFTRRGHRVTVLTGMPNYPSGRLFKGYGALRPATEEYAGARVLRHPLITRGKGSALRLVLNYVSAAFFACLFGMVRARGRFDVIFTFEPSPITVGLPAALLRSLRGAPTVLWVQDLWPESLVATGMVKSPLLVRIAESLVRFVYRTTDLILVQSEAFRARVEPYAPRNAAIEYVPNWAEDFYRPVDPADCAAEKQEFPAGFRIVFAGNIGAAQSIETVLDAAEQLDPSIQWLFFGDGHRLPWLQEQIASRSLADRVRVLGSRPATAMPKYFAAADALLVSLRDEPIFALTVPSKLQSYLACARPVIAMLGGEGARIVAQAQAGVVVPPGQASELAKAALQLRAMSGEARAQMGERGRQYYETHFERRRTIDRLEELIMQTARSQA